MYLDDCLGSHPLANLVMVPDWSGSPPIYICTGWEILAYEDKFLAQKLYEDGVPIRFEEYEAMPHCFALLQPKLPGARRCYDGWAKFIQEVVKTPQNIVSSAVTIKAKTLKEVPLRFEDLCQTSEDAIRDRVFEKVGRKNSPEISAKL